MAVGACLLALAGCGETEATDDEAADATSQATYKVAGKVVLPPEGEGYKVIGRVAGLNKYVVQYDERLYRGGQPLTAEGLTALKKWGIKTIVSVTPDDHERKFAEENGFALVEVPFGHGVGIPAEVLSKFLKTTTQQAGGIYVHCMGGSHRAGALCLAYRVHVAGWAYDKALIEYGRLGGDLKGDFVMVESVRAKP